MAWALAPRAAMDEQVAFARQVACQAAYLTGRLDDAVTHANAALAAGPYDEVSLRWLMQAHQAAGRAGAALAAYARMRLGCVTTSVPTPIPRRSGCTPPCWRGGGTKTSDRPLRGVPSWSGATGSTPRWTPPSRAAATRRSSCS